MGFGAIELTCRGVALIVAKQTLAPDPGSEHWTGAPKGKWKMCFAAGKGGLLCQDLVARQTYLQPVVAANLLGRG